MSRMIMFYVPCPSKKEALKVAHALVSRKLIACANILDGCTSVYEWKGEIQEEQEVVLIMKTVKSLHLEVEKAITELHSYECPCVVALDTAEVNLPFVQWVERQINPE